MFVMKFDINLKKVSAAALFFLLASRVFASGVNDPSLYVSTVSDNARQIILDWSKVRNPESSRYGIYRANRSDKTISLVREVTQDVWQVVDGSLLPPLINYFYFVHHVSADNSLDPFIIFPEGRRITEEEMSGQLSNIYMLNGSITEAPPIDYEERGGGLQEQGAKKTSKAQAQKTFSKNAPEAAPPAANITAGAQADYRNDSRFKLPEGIYMGLAFFSNKVDTPPALIALDPAGRREIIERLNVNYNAARTNGTALFYAEHIALESLFKLERQGRLPPNIDSVNVITFTDGLDTSSTDVALPPPSSDVSFAGKQTNSYMNYISQQLKTRRVGGKKLNAWAIGIPGRDVTNDAEFTRTLEAVASSPANVAYLNDLAQIEGQLMTIADRLNIWTPVVKLTFTTPAYSVGTIVRITLDDYISSAGESGRYFEGRIAYDDNANRNYMLSGLTGKGVTIPARMPIEGKRTPKGIEYTITLNDAVDENTLMQWYRQPGSNGGVWQLNSEFDKSKISDFTSSRKSALIYLVLDCSSSLDNYQIVEIRTSITRFIDRLFNTASASVKPNITEGRYEGNITGIHFNAEGEQPPQYQTQPQYVYPQGGQYTQARQPQMPSGRPIQQEPRYVEASPPAPYYQSMPQIQYQPAVPKNQQYPPPPVEPYPQQPRLVEQYIIQKNAPDTAVQIVPALPRNTVLFLPAPVVNANEPYSGYWVQVGSFNDISYAQDVWRKLYLSNCVNTEIFAKVLNGIMYYRVKVGPYQDRSDAEYAAGVIRAAAIGFDDAYVVHQ
ncbi:MAG: SPOR domain-containing protein [Spirochaetaceae bacterium]|jgi:hypothetical protein|nr:SPOR domain-containing protein [Spirochaetaceae bacterium]